MVNRWLMRQTYSSTPNSRSYSVFTQSSGVSSFCHLFWVSLALRFFNQYVCTGFSAQSLLGWCTELNWIRSSGKNTFEEKVVHHKFTFTSHLTIQNNGWCFRLTCNKCASNVPMENLSHLRWLIASQEYPGRPNEAEPKTLAQSELNWRRSIKIKS